MGVNCVKSHDHGSRKMHESNSGYMNRIFLCVCLFVLLLPLTPIRTLNDEIHDLHNDVVMFCCCFWREGG